MIRLRKCKPFIRTNPKENMSTFMEHANWTAWVLKLHHVWDWNIYMATSS